MSTSSSVINSGHISCNSDCPLFWCVICCFTQYCHSLIWRVCFSVLWTLGVLFVVAVVADACFFIIVDLWLSLLSCKINVRLFFSTIYEVLSQVYEVLSLLKLSTTTLSLRTLIVWLLIFFTSCCACSFNYLWHYSSSIFCCICVHFQRVSWKISISYTQF